MNKIKLILAIFFGLIFLLTTIIMLYISQEPDIFNVNIHVNKISKKYNIERRQRDY